MTTGNTPQYPWSAGIRILHALVGLLILGNAALGFQMTTTQERLFAGDAASTQAFGLELFEAYLLHKSLGVTILILTIIRVAERLRSNSPKQHGVSAWETGVARTVHVGLNLALGAVLISGWIMASASPLGLPISVFGLWDWPAIAQRSVGLEEQAKAARLTSVLALAILVFFHVAGAIKNLFLGKRVVLLGMFWKLPRE